MTTARPDGDVVAGLEGVVAFDTRIAELRARKPDRPLSAV